MDEFQRLVFKLEGRFEDLQSRQSKMEADLKEIRDKVSRIEGATAATQLVSAVNDLQREMAAVSAMLEMTIEQMPEKSRASIKDSIGSGGLNLQFNMNAKGGDAKSVGGNVEGDLTGGDKTQNG